MSRLTQTDSVSVVIGSYNAAAWIRAAIESVLSQTHLTKEVFVIDDGSTDQTAEIARSYGPAVRLVQETHRGRPHRNRGIEASSGAWLAFLDADDYWAPTKLQRQMERLRDRKAQWAVCEAAWHDSATDGPVPSPGMTLMEGDILEPLFLHNFIVASTPIVSRQVLEAVGGFDESADVAPVEDWDLWLRIAARYPLACVWEQLATVRLHSDSFLASTPLARRVHSLENVISRAANREPVRLAPMRDLALHNAYFSAGVGAFRKGLRSEARGYFIRAWRKQPTDMAALAYVCLTWMHPRTSAGLIDSKRRMRRR